MNSQKRVEAESEEAAEGDDQSRPVTKRARRFCRSWRAVWVRSPWAEVFEEGWQVDAGSSRLRKQRLRRGVVAVLSTARRARKATPDVGRGLVNPCDSAIGGSLASPDCCQRLDIGGSDQMVTADLLGGQLAFGDELPDPGIGDAQGVCGLPAAEVALHVSTVAPGLRVRK